MSATAWVFLDANTPWVYTLAKSLAMGGHSVEAIAPYDAQTFRRERPRWPEGDVPLGFRRVFWVLPPGYAGALAPIFGPLMRWRLARVLAEAGKNSAPWVITAYPWFHRAVRDVPDERLIYYNLDDYSLYRPKRADLVRQQEDELLHRAALTLCLSRQQASSLRARIPTDRRERILHFPLGVAEEYFNPHPEQASAARTVGYVGNLVDRVDWRLVGATASALPDVEFVFVGGLGGFSGGGMRPDWEAERAAALSLPNVRHIGPVLQGDVPRHYWSFGVNWIPYATDHAFNQAACPTKIMDGLASGRPVLSTRIPECELYPKWIRIIDSAPAAADAIGRLLSVPPESGHTRAQVEFARQHSWTERARLFAQWLENADYTAVHK